MFLTFFDAMHRFTFKQLLGCLSIDEYDSHIWLVIIFLFQINRYNYNILNRNQLFYYAQNKNKYYLPGYYSSVKKTYFTSVHELFPLLPFSYSIYEFPGWKMFFFLLKLGLY